LDDFSLPKVTLEPGFIIIGMDPAASRNCGWAALEWDGKKPVLKDKYTQDIGVAEGESHLKRFRLVYDELLKIIDKHHPKILCMERSTGGGLIFVRSNLSETVGVAKLCCYDKSVLVYETSPGHLKKIITGHGRAKKKHIKANIVAEFGLKKPGPEHECDACSCALSLFVDLGYSSYIPKVPCIDPSK
jgi:crossover junction endodeoxyribonuclease RuvC